MSRGPGRIEQSIGALFEGAPSIVFTVEDLAMIVYPGGNRPEKWHRVAVLRAGRHVAARLWWACRRREAPHGEIVFFNLLDVRSYALGRLRCDFANNDLTLGELERLIDDPSVHRSAWRLVQPEGAWSKHVKANLARRDGNEELAEKIMAEVRAGALANMAAGL